MLPPVITFHANMDNVLGPNLLQRRPGNITVPGGFPIGQNGPEAMSLGKFDTPQECVAACVEKYPNTCFSATHYGPGSSATTPSGCFAVTTQYFDWFPAIDRQGLKHVTTARVWHGCIADEDCAKNGVCSGGSGGSGGKGTCACASGWKGHACTQLDLTPTLSGQDAGYNYVLDGENVSSWGGVPLEAEDGLYHMWVSHFTEHCGIIAWGENSIILHTTSINLLGPYTPANGTITLSTTFPIFSHEPSVVRGPDGEWVMFMSRHVPNTGRPICSCQNGVTPDNCTDYATPDMNPTAMSWANSPNGPWSEPVTIISGVHADSNLAPLIRADGSLLGLWRSFNDSPAWTGHADWKISAIHMVVATNWKDPSTYIFVESNWNSSDIFDAAKKDGMLRGPTEDPWLFLGHDGTLHALFHNMYGCYACCGHAFATTTTTTDEEVIAWTYTGADACGPLVEHLDGSTTVLGRRERPHLLFDAQQRPIMLTNGVTVCPTTGYAVDYCPTPRNSDRSWTLAQPIRTKM